MNDITPLELLTEDQIKQLLKLIKGSNNDSVRKETWDNMIRFLDGEKNHKWVDVEDLIEWMKL